MGIKTVEKRVCETCGQEVADNDAGCIRHIKNQLDLEDIVEHLIEAHLLDDRSMFATDSYYKDFHNAHHELLTKILGRK